MKIYIRENPTWILEMTEDEVKELHREITENCQWDCNECRTLWEFQTNLKERNLKNDNN